MLLLTLMVTYLLGIYFHFFIVKYSVLFGLFNFGLGLGLLNLASTSASSIWPRLTFLGSMSSNCIDRDQRVTASLNCHHECTVLYCGRCVRQWSDWLRSAATATTAAAAASAGQHWICTDQHSIHAGTASRTALHAGCISVIL